MRFVSSPVDGYTIFAVSGLHTISFAIDASDANTRGLLGFSIERYDPAEEQRYFMYNLKVFRELVPNPSPTNPVNSFDHPVQSFVWDDFTAKPGREYTYIFHPIKGKPKNLDRSAQPIEIKVKTEALYDRPNGHSVFFNRGVASSQAYARVFNNQRPDELEGEEREKACQWLGRGLDKALLDFIGQAREGDQLRAAVYEFHFPPVVKAFKEAVARGVDVKIIFDAKDNSRTDKKGKFHEAFPREANLRAVQKARLPKRCLVPREANEGDIQHNKFIVYSRNGVPTSVWTGSTNLSEGGIYGQTNVGHRIDNPELAQQFYFYWILLSKDPGAQPGDDNKTRRADNKAFKVLVENLQSDLAPEDIPQGVTPIFSPRTSDAMLRTYARMVDSAKKNACITLAFGVGKAFKDLLKDNTAESQLVFLLLEKEDKAKPDSKDPFIDLTWRHNIYEAFGENIKDPLYQWTKETTTRDMGLNKHVAYIHTKFLLMDPLSDDPIVVTGSANFSEPSTKANDENMLLIRGNKRVADIYFTEFMRLFNHYYFRNIFSNLKEAEQPQEETAFLQTTDKWLKKYKKGTLRYKRLALFTQLAAYV